MLVAALSTNMRSFTLDGITSVLNVSAILPSLLLARLRDARAGNLAQT
jgi:hypothetical protein